jgi:hypothetical protein
MNHNRWICSCVIALLLALSLAAQTPKRATSKQKPPAAEANPADRITIEQLKRKLDAKEELVIIDTRTGLAWTGTTVKIKGAIHITLEQLEARMKDLPKNREIVTYCT